MAPPPKSFQETLKELWELLTAYARQETIGPFKNLGRRIGFGVAGSLLFALGWFLLALAIVRFLDTHTLPWAGDWFRVHDWVTYFIAAVFIVIGMYLGALRKIRHPDPGLATPAGAAGDPVPATRSTP